MNKAERLSFEKLADWSVVDVLDNSTGEEGLK